MIEKHRCNYRGVNLRKELLDDLDKIIKDHPETGYTSTADAVSEAVRLKVQQLKDMYPSKS